MYTFTRTLFCPLDYYNFALILNIMRIEFAGRKAQFDVVLLKTLWTLAASIVKLVLCTRGLISEMYPLQPRWPSVVCLWLQATKSHVLINQMKMFYSVLKDFKPKCKKTIKQDFYSKYWGLTILLIFVKGRTDYVGFLMFFLHYVYSFYVFETKNVIFRFLSQCTRVSEHCWPQQPCDPSAAKIKRCEWFWLYAVFQKGQIPARFRAEPRPPVGFREFKYPGWPLQTDVHVKCILDNYEHTSALRSSFSAGDMWFLAHEDWLGRPWPCPQYCGDSGQKLERAANVGHVWWKAIALAYVKIKHHLRHKQTKRHFRLSVEFVRGVRPTIRVDEVRYFMEINQ